MWPEKGYLGYISDKNISLLISEQVWIPKVGPSGLKYLEKW